MLHELKCVQPFFDAVYSGKKPFEVRKDDRNYQVGDTLQLREYHEKTGYGNLFVERQVTYVLTHYDFPDGVPEGWCILGLK